MANPLYENMIASGVPGVPLMQPGQQPMGMPAMSGMQFANPLQKMNYIMQAMTNPAAFVRQHLPNIPEEAFRDPTGNRVLQYMQQNLGVTQQDIQNAQNQIPVQQRYY